MGKQSRPREGRATSVDASISSATPATRDVSSQFVAAGGSTTFRSKADVAYRRATAAWASRGEPTIRRDLARLIALGRKIGFSYIGSKPTVCLPIRRTRLLTRAGLTVKLPSTYNSRLHDRLVGARASSPAASRRQS